MTTSPHWRCVPRSARREVRNGRSAVAHSPLHSNVARAIAFDIAGPLGAPRIVLLHGVALTRAMWEPQIEALADEFRVTALDLPGHGTLAGEPFRLEIAVEQVAEIIGSTGEGPAVVVGLSLGSYVAMAYAREHPEQVSGLVLSGCCMDYRLWGRLSALDAWLVLRIVGAERVRKMQERTLRGMLSPELAERQIAAGFTFAEMPRAYRELARHDFRQVLHAYTGPALILNGERDRLNRRGERRMLDAARRGTVCTIAEAGHACNLEQPEQFNAAVREFMRTVEQGDAC